MANLSETAPSDGKVLYPVSVALLVLSLVFGFALLPRLFNGAHAGPLIETEATNFTLEVVANGAEGKKSLALSDLRGHPVILDFWATWCGPCQAEAPILNKVAQRFKDRGLVVVGVNVMDQPGNAGPWARAHGITFPIVFDDKGVADHYTINSLPTLVVISKEGKILAMRVGATTEAEIEDLVIPAL